MKIKVEEKGCIDCPFYHIEDVLERSDFSLFGLAWIGYCHVFDNVADNEPIRVHVSYSMDIPEKIKPPHWCPLRREKLTVELKVNDEEKA